MAPIEPTVIAPGVPHPAVLFPNTPCPAQHGGAFLCVLRRAKEKPHCAAGQGVFLGGTSPGYQGDRARGSRGIYLRGRPQHPHNTKRPRNQVKRDRRLESYVEGMTLFLPAATRNVTCRCPCCGKLLQLPPSQ